MYKFLALFLVICLCFFVSAPLAFADKGNLPESFDVGSFTDAELLAIVAACNGELGARERDTDVLYDNDGVKILLDGFEYSYYEHSDSLFFMVNIAVLNSTGEKVRVRVEDTYIDGWQDDLENRIEAAPNRNTRDYFITGLDQSGIKTVKELKKISSLEMELRVEIGDEDEYVTVTVTDFSSLKESED